jgi:hypothetical protein
MHDFAAALRVAMFSEEGARVNYLIGFVARHSTTCCKIAGWTRTTSRQSVSESIRSGLSTARTIAGFCRWMPMRFGTPATADKPDKPPVSLQAARTSNSRRRPTLLKDLLTDAEALRLTAKQVLELTIRPENTTGSHSPAAPAQPCSATAFIFLHPGSWKPDKVRLSQPKRGQPKRAMRHITLLHFGTSAKIGSP